MRHTIPLSVLFLGIVLPVAAQEAPSASTSAVYACAELSENEARLACYDDAVGRLKSAEEAGEAIVVTRDEVEEVRRESFGFSIPSLPGLASSVFRDEGELKEVTHPVAAVAQTPRGQMYVTLENGQVWQQTDQKQVYYSKRRGVKTVTIKSAAFGSFMMKFDDGLPFRAERVN